MRRDYPPIEDHGVIGDLHTVALVARDGTIGFMCAPRFDSPPVFASLLDRERGGRFELAPVLDGARLKQLYLPDTNVLLTRFLSPDGVAEISDFMPVGETDRVRAVVRRAKAVRGDLKFHVRCAPRFGYGPQPHRVSGDDGCVLFLPSEGDVAARLWTTAPVRIHEGDAVAEFTLRHGESATFVLEVGDVSADSPVQAANYAAASFKRTANFWRRWIGKSTYRGRWRDEVNRSALVLKLLVSQPFGSLVAAPTFSLPERLGGVRNWDYRYTWIRDAAFTLYSLIRLGMTDETGAFIEWISRLGHDFDQEIGPLQPLYRIDGGKDVEEFVLDGWEGYRGSRPVRVGNGAGRQCQLDVYGALMDSVYLYDKYGQPISHDFWMRLTGIVDWVCENWRRPDRGIWEVRAGDREYLNSRVLCWVAVDRAIRLAQRRSLPGPLVRWLEVRDEIYRSVFSEMWSERKKAFVQHAGSDEVDAAALLLPLLRFISPTDPRWKSTMKAITRELVEDSLVRRYRIRGGETDGFADDEGTFTICSFWYAECLSRGGDLQQARFVFEKVLGYANHLGLFAEQLGPSGEHLGNFPQAFTHLSLISAAYDIDRRLDDAGWRA
ncbi:MAG: glycoside hydrolase family 15 protein [Gemmatimonadetes bacterium]|nr:glycoside hydrolase family 15 protein [Gemmatimonadota bacterium]